MHNSASQRWPRITAAALGGVLLGAALLDAGPGVDTVAGQATPTATVTQTPVPTAVPPAVTATVTPATVAPSPSATVAPSPTQPAPLPAAPPPPPAPSSAQSAVVPPGATVTLGGITLVSQSGQPVAAALAGATLSLTVEGPFILDVPGRECRFAIEPNRVTCTVAVAPGERITFSTAADDGGRGVVRQAPATPAPAVPAPAAPQPASTAAPPVSAPPAAAPAQPVGPVASAPRLAPPAPVAAPAQVAPRPAPVQAAPRPAAPAAVPGGPAVALPRTGAAPQADTSVTIGTGAVALLGALFAIALMARAGARRVR